MIFLNQRKRAGNYGKQTTADKNGNVRMTIKTLIFALFTFSMGQPANETVYDTYFKHIEKKSTYNYEYY